MLPKLSCAMSGISRAGSVFDAVNTVKAAGFDGIDFALSTYARDGDALASDEGWKDWVLRVKDCLDELSLPVMQAHAPWDQTIPQDFSYLEPDPIFYRAMEACRMLGCRRLVFHPLLYPFRIGSEALYDPIHAYNRRWFRALLPTAERLGITIELENLFDYYHVQQLGDPIYIYSKADHMTALADALSDGPVGFCLDTGHANISGQSVPEMIRIYGSRLDCLHLNDNYGKTGSGKEDLHLPPGEGNLNWDEIFSALREIGYPGTCNLELIADLAEHSMDRRIARLRASREDLERRLLPD